MKNNQIMDMKPKDVIASDPYSSIVYLFDSFIFFCSLPFPWLLSTLVKGVPVSVNSGGVACSIGLLFLMLVLVFLSIIVCKWKMTRPMGVFMGILYIGFVIVSVGLEGNDCSAYRIVCPFGGQ